MRNVQVLDCTLRDGGRIIDCEFGDKTISDMAKDLTLAGVDIVEMGFLRAPDIFQYKSGCTFFNNVSDLKPFIPPNRKGAMYVAFIDFNMYDFSKLEVCDGSSVTGIRVGFTKEQFITRRDEIKKALCEVKEKGYKLFVQGVNSLAYSDKELLELIEVINETEPYSYGIVDTYGAMYLEDMIHFYELVDYNLASDICIDVHSHNNFQSSFAFAQEIIKLANGKRNIILDATLNGMGKGAGNLNTELIVDYLVRKKNSDYDIDRILDCIDKYLVPLKDRCAWGYSVPAFMAGIYKSHPNNVIYLTEKYRLNSKDIKYILSGIDETVRQRYDYDIIQRIYRTYNENLTDDRDSIRELYKKLRNRSILILAPGRTVSEFRDEIEEYIRMANPIVISVNFVPEHLKCDWYFYANTIHWERICDEISHERCIVSSNIHVNTADAYIVNYSSLIEEDSILYDNSTIMLLNLLKRVEVSEIAIAGFDGLKESGENYIDNHMFSNTVKEISVADTNKEVRRLYEQYKDKVLHKIKVRILTPSIYERGSNGGKF